MSILKPYKLRVLIRALDCAFPRTKVDKIPAIDHKKNHFIQNK